MGATPTKSMTFAEFEQLPDEVCRRHELPQYEYRIADVAYVTRERWERIADNDNLRGAPELVIELLSPSNTKAMMREKGALCLGNGCLESWVVDEGNRSITVSTPNAVTTTYRSGQLIPL